MAIQYPSPAESRQPMGLWKIEAHRCPSYRMLAKRSPNSARVNLTQPTVQSTGVTTVTQVLAEQFSRQRWTCNNGAIEDRCVA
jgi:hypothetical protein